jgi:hypothetical protein
MGRWIARAARTADDGAAARAPVDVMETVRALVALGDVDALYADRYQARAETTLAAVCPEARFLRLAAEAAALEQLVEHMRDAAARGDWARLRILARDGAAAQARREAERDLRAVAGAVYGARGGGPSTPALALGRVLDARSAERERIAAEQQLRYLCQHDAGWASFYRGRLAHFVALGEAVGPASSVVDADALRQRVLAALEHTDFEGVRRMLDASVAPAAHATTPVAGHARCDRPRAIDGPFDAAVRCRAEELGLDVATLAAEPALASCLASWCRWEPDGGDPPARAERSDCGRPCPVLGRQALWESLNFLVVRPCATSAGTPYRPLFDAESMLVERFAEDDADAPSALLALLGLPRRRGLSRTSIERAVRRGSAAVCTALGLDPFAFTLALIPFDAYVRLAPARSWGEQPLWTHFDGYRLAPGGVLRALVGGDCRYGGADGLCGVGRDYDGAHLLARFVVLHRQRLS